MLSSAGKEFEFEFLTISDSSSVFFLTYQRRLKVFFSFHFFFLDLLSQQNKLIAFFFLNEG
jgi:hypothetical protein